MRENRVTYQRASGTAARRRGWPIAALLALAVSLPVAGGGFSAPSAVAAPGDGTLTVEVNRDFSGDGVYDALYDPPQAGISVSVTDGVTTLGPTDTGANGQVVFDLSLLAGPSFRVDVLNDDPALDHLVPAPAAPASTPNAFRSVTTFVGGATQTIHVGVWNPDDYVTENPPLSVIQQKDRGTAGTARSVAITRWNNRGDDGTTADATVGFETIATQAETGTVFGSAWDHRANVIYSAAFAKAHTLYGPGGSGAIYRTSAVQPSTPGTTVTWAVVPNAGTSVHDTATGIDDAFYYATGREALGGLALSEDGATLYAVNLNDRSLYSFATASAAPAPVAGVVPIGDPGCVGGQWRPAAVAVRDGEVYVGGVCDASTSLLRSDLVAHVLRLDGASFAPVFSKVLDFARGNQNYSDPPGNLTGSGVSTHWNPWRNTWDPDIQAYAVAGSPLYPTPLLSDIEFENDGSLILGFRDLFSDQLVSNGFSPSAVGRVPIGGQIAGGDINKVCLANGIYEWEGTGSCPNNNTPANSGNEPAGRVEYFPGDFIVIGGIRHYENSMGGMAFSPREPEIANLTMDPTGRFNTGGVGFYDRFTGLGPGNDPVANGLLVAGNSAVNFAKGNGLGDLSILAALAPVQIGNRVWFDVDNDGEQDAAVDEPGIPFVTVRLLAADGVTVLDTVTTDANGEYYFGGEGGYPLVPGEDYIVEFDYSTIDASTLPGSPTLDGLVYTGTETVGPSLDSNAVGVPGFPTIGRAPVTAPATPGGVDHTIDAGISPARVDIEKGDTGSDAPGPFVNDADDSSTGQAYTDGETRAIRFDVANTGPTPLYNVTVTDDTLGGDVTVVGLACVFPGQVAPGTAGVLTGTTWTVDWAATFGNAAPQPTAWEPEQTFTCTATLTLAGGDVPHVDRAVVLTNLQPTGQPGDADQTGPTDRDDYVAFTGEIQVIKYDGNLADPIVGSGPISWTPPTKPLADGAQDANTPGQAVTYPAGAAQPVRWVVTNTGATWLADLTLADQTDDGPAVGAWTCDLGPVGGPSGYSFTSDGPWAGPLAPGASFFCEGPLTLPADTTHADTVDVTGTVVVPNLDDEGQPILDQDGVPTYVTNGGGPLRTDVVVGDDDPFHAITEAVPPTTTSTTTSTTTTVPGATTTPPTTGPGPTVAPPGPAPSTAVPNPGGLPVTGSDASRAAGFAAAAATLGVLLILVGRRRRSPGRV